MKTNYIFKVREKQMKFELNLLDSKICEKEFVKRKNLTKFEKFNTFLHSGEENWTAWVDYPSKTINHLQGIKDAANKVKKNGDVLIVIGIGGSYLGASACISALSCNSSMKVEFCGLNFSNEDLIDIFEKNNDKNVYVNVISKSGRTTETIIAFDYAVSFLKSKYKSKFKDHLFITTDKSTGYLRDFATKHNVISFEIPEKMGGRFSVLSAGLFPMLCAGIDIDKLLKGACLAEEDLKLTNSENPAYRYALSRYLLNKKGKYIELLSTFYPRLSGIGAWWTQLFAESEGKDKKGIFPTNLNFSRDLHSVGQFIQQGTPIVFETFLSVDEVGKDRILEKIDESSPIKYLEGKSVEEVNLAAQKGTIEAHISANVPVLQITIGRVDEEHIGYILYFFELACALSGKFLGIDPFDQPGVEDYKRNLRKYLINN